MKLLIAVEHHFMRGEDGGVYTPDPIQYDFFKSHLGRFTEIVVLARVNETAQQLSSALRADGPGVSFAALPDYRGPWQFLLRMGELRKRVNETIQNCDAYLLRLPGVVGELVRRELRRSGREFGVQVVGDPTEVFAPGAHADPLRPLFRWLFARQLRKACAQAAAVAYVSSHTLPEKYPSAPKIPNFVFSNVMLKDAVLSEAEAAVRAEGLAQPKAKFQIGTIASLHVPYKGVDVLLRAVALCVQRGMDVHLTVVGEGALRPRLKGLGQELGIAGRTVFAGQVPAGRDVYRFLDGLDLYVQPSRTEGLPRALIEAMARGCPAIASAVGGIPELLPEEHMVPPDDAPALAEKILQCLTAPGLLPEMSRENRQKASAYDFHAIQARRVAFLHALAGVTEGAKAVCAG